MKNDHKVEVRRAIMLRLKPGGTVRIAIPGARPSDIADTARKFCRSRKRNIQIEIDGDAVVLRETENNGAPKRLGRPPLPPTKLRYPIGDLAVGASVLVELAPSDHAKLRNYASARARAIGWKFSCRAEPGGIRVTREQ